MPVTLNAISLPDDIIWRDEYSGFGVGQVITPTLTTALVVEEVAQVAGRSITLETGEDAWVEKSVVDALNSLVATPLNDTTLPLVWGDGRSFDVVFDRSSGAAVEAREIFPIASADKGTDHIYSLTIRLITA